MRLLTLLSVVLVAVSAQAQPYASLSSESHAAVITVSIENGQPTIGVEGSTNPTASVVTVQAGGVLVLRAEDGLMAQMVVTPRLGFSVDTNGPNAALAGGGYGLGVIRLGNAQAGNRGFTLHDVSVMMCTSMVNPSPDAPDGTPQRCESWQALRVDVEGESHLGVGLVIDWDSGVRHRQPVPYIPDPPTGGAADPPLYD